MKRRAVMIRVPEWMHNALKAEARSRAVPVSVNRMVIEALLDKYRSLQKAMAKAGKRG